MSEVQTRVHYDSDGDLTTFETVQDCEPSMVFAKARHLDGIHGSSDFKHAASIPLVLVEKYCQIHGITSQDWFSNPEHIRRMLNDRDLSAFRIWPGAV